MNLHTRIFTSVDQLIGENVEIKKTFIDGVFTDITITRTKRPAVVQGFGDIIQLSAEEFGELEYLLGMRR